MISDVKMLDNKTTTTRWQDKNIRLMRLPHTHYTLSVAIEVVQLFVPPRGSRQLCAPLAARCGLAERLYHYVRVAKNILLYSLYWALNAGLGI